MSTKSRIASGAVAVALVAGIGIGVAGFASSANDRTPATVETEAPAETIDYTKIPFTNGLAGEQESDAAAAEAARVESERIATEAAAAEAARIESERVAAEQAAAESAYADEQARQPEQTQQDSGSDPWAGKMRVPWIADPNPENAAGGWWDTSQCPNGSASTGPDGVAYCD